MTRKLLDEPLFYFLYYDQKDLKACWFSSECIEYDDAPPPSFIEFIPGESLEPDQLVILAATEQNFLEETISRTSYMMEVVKIAIMTIEENDACDRVDFLAENKHARTDLYNNLVMYAKAVLEKQVAVGTRVSVSSLISPDKEVEPWMNQRIYN